MLLVQLPAIICFAGCEHTGRCLILVLLRDLSKATPGSVAGIVGALMRGVISPSPQGRHSFGVIRSLPGLLAGFGGTGTALEKCLPVEAGWLDGVCPQGNTEQGVWCEQVRCRVLELVPESVLRSRLGEGKRNRICHRFCFWRNLKISAPSQCTF